MNMLFDLETVQEGVDSYHSIIEELKQTIENVTTIKNGIDQKTWNGESEESFEKALAAWISRVNVVISDITQSCEALTRFAGNSGRDLRITCENMADSF